MTGDVSLLGDVVIVAGRRIRLSYLADDAFTLDGRLIVLYAPTSERGKVGQFNNLVALGDEGDEVWTAELPTGETGDCYYRVVSHASLVAISVKSFVCTLDSMTGRITSREFVK